MAKKRSHPIAVPKAPLQLTAGETHERELKEANVLWTKAVEAASRSYDQVMNSAWHRYANALKAFQETNGKKAKSGETDFSKRYDQDRETALKGWNHACAAADARF